MITCYYIANVLILEVKEDDMARVTYIDCIGKLSRYEIILYATIRARYLADQANKNLYRLNNTNQFFEKSTVVALRDLALKNSKELSQETA